MNTISVDHPGRVDQFGRTAFARRLLDVVSKIEAESSGAVIGLEGEWGSGKTWVVRQLESLIDELPPLDDSRSAARWVQFNPWMISGTNGLVEALLVQLAASAGEIAPASGGLDLATSLLEYAGLLGAMKHIGPVAASLAPLDGGMTAGIVHAASIAGSAAGGMADLLRKVKREPQRLSLQHVRARVAALLAGESRVAGRWIVCIDDIDRLPPHEVAALMQAVKAVADFPNVVYLLCYDRKVVAQSLKTALQLEDGEAFLEKIVQLPFVLPQVPVRKLNAYATQRLESVVLRERCEPQEIEDLGEVWPMVFALIDVPRDVERLRTRLAVTIPVLQNEVNIADVILMEALALLTPGVLRWALANQGVLITHGHAFPERQARGELGDSLGEVMLTARMSDQQKRDRAQQAQTGWEHACATDRQRVPVREALRWLFDMGRSKSNEPSTFRRLKDGPFWYRWRCFHDHEIPWEVTEVVELLEDPVRRGTSELLTTKPEFEAFCAAIELLGVGNLRESAKAFDASLIAALFVMASERFGPLHGEGRKPGCLDAVAIAICLDVDQDRRKLALHNLIAGVPPADGAIVLLAIKERLGRNADEIIGEMQLAELVSSWRERCMAAAVGDSIRTGDEAVLIAFRFSHLKCEAEASRQFLDSWVSNDDERLQAVLQCFDDSFLRFSMPPWEWLPSPDRLAPIVRRLAAERSSYDGLLKLVDELPAASAEGKLSS